MTLDEVKVSLKRYVEVGCPTGGFLRAVLRNDLIEAVCRADESSLSNLLQIARYVYNDLPSSCWKSEEAVTRWLEQHYEVTYGTPGSTKHEDALRWLRARGINRKATP